MKKLLSIMVAGVFATASISAFAGAHGGAMSDADKAKKMEECKKMDEKKADDKMKSMCKKMMDEAKPKKDEPKK